MEAVRSRLSGLLALFPRHGIGRRLLLTLLAGLAVLNVVMTAVSTAQLSGALEEAIRTEIALAETLVAQPVSAALWQLDPGGAENGLRGLSAMTHFAAAKVIAEDEVFASLAATAAVPEEAVVSRVPLLSPDEAVIGMLELTFDAGPIQDRVAFVRIRTILFGVTVFLLAGLIVAALSISIVQPIRAAVVEIEGLRDGRTEDRIESAARRDEVGQVGRALDVLRRALLEKQELEREKQHRDAEEARLAIKRNEENARAEAERTARMQEQERVVTTLAAALQRVAAGDLRCTLTEPFDSIYEPLRHDYNAAIHRLSDVVAKITESAGTLSAQAKTMSSFAHDLSQRSETAAAALRQTRSATTSLAKTASDAARDTESFAKVSEQVRQITAEKRDVVRNAVGAMDDVEMSSTEIGKITLIISKIASQISILSINASIEAARAGPSGAGFAVVAESVRDLASQTARAAEEIEGSVERRSTIVTDGLTYIREADTALERIGNDVVSLSEGTQSLSTTVSAQSEDVASIDSAMVEIEGTIREGAIISNDAARASATLSQEASRLDQLVSQFQIENGSSALTSISQRNADLGLNSSEPKAARH
ncbi:methyl-accepting chemotaxis protein [Pontivivens ytuae]|uniref:HAMP domain-containing protein n=1 Tax=Pontivivens ytuae TaxID=2789856 RepID=A0A7S9LS10_9RHOB|nr:methyl-accepting chemotaxis protein [Pontivivens ytuae]QPH54241.1 HAMP domain-containing protein [Pontivivens ytuae]